MQYRVRDWMMDLVVYVDPDATVTEALALMRRRYINSLIVNRTDNNPEYGIVTSIDVSDKIVAQERNPGDLKVREIMTSPLITVHKDMSLKECSRLMREKHIHHLPVTDDDGKILGMIAAADFLVAAEAMGRKPGEKII
jgi:signal-transduction protein with cAMP-binding, CBS, and nucleotidyltransferase domain